MDEDNRRTVEAWGERLAGDGHFVLDVWNREAITRRFEPRRIWTASAELQVTEERALDPSAGRLSVHYAYDYADGRHVERDASFRLYSLGELEAIVGDAKMGVTEVYGSLTGAPYSADEGRLVVFARRP